MMDLRREQLTLSTMALLSRGQLRCLEEKYVTRTRKCVPDKFINLCHMHLAFLLDLSDDKLEILLSAPDEYRKKKSSLVSVGVFKKKEKLQTDLFGAPLTDEGVCLMIPLMNFLKLETNICKEGLFRKPGNKIRMTALRELLITHGPAVSIDHEVYSPYDVACVLKEFLRELPEPLLTERHMEAHRQVACLGKNARTPEEIARYDHKKLSALQLLMLLLPAPAQKLTIKLLRLLLHIANCAETKMTPATLGTIFAPIFFIDRSVEASDLCMQISQMAPAVSFMIEKSHDLVHAPKELVIDLANYWNSQPSPPTDTSESDQVKKSLNGCILNTNVCYIDRELSRCDDVAGNTQAELANLFAHVQCLPNTPNNIKLKKQILKSTTTPLSSTKKYSQSKCLTSSIKKRLPSLGRSKVKQGNMPRVSNSSIASKDDQEKENATPSMCELLESPAYPTEQKGQQRPSRLRRRYQQTSENNENSTDSECTPPKQECKGIATCDAGTVVSENQVSCQEKLSSKTCLRDKNVLTSLTSSPIKSVHERASSASPRFTACSPKNAFFQSENEITYLPHYTVKKITAPLTPNRDSIHVTSVQPRKCKPPRTPVMPRAPLQLARNNALETSI